MPFSKTQQQILDMVAQGMDDFDRAEAGDPRPDTEARRLQRGADLIARAASHAGNERLLAGWNTEREAAKELISQAEAAILAKDMLLLEKIVSQLKETEEGRIALADFRAWINGACSIPKEPATVDELMDQMLAAIKSGNLDALPTIKDQLKATPEGQEALDLLIRRLEAK